MGDNCADNAREWVEPASAAHAHALHEIAVGAPEALSGFYHRNVRVGELLVRVPIAGAHGMDLKIWPEHEVLAAIGPHVDDVPRLVFACVDPEFQVHGFVTGELLDDLAPRGERVPAHVPGDVVALCRQLVDVPFRDLPAVPYDWPADGDTVTFARRLSTITVRCTSGSGTTTPTTSGGWASRTRRWRPCAGTR